MKTHDVRHPRIIRKPTASSVSRTLRLQKVQAIIEILEPRESEDETKTSLTEAFGERVEAARGASETAVGASMKALDAAKTALDASDTALDASETALDASNIALKTSETALGVSAIKLDATELALDASELALDASELALNASELRYRQLFESAKDGILILDAETGMVVDVNPSLTRTLGLSHDQFLRKTIWNLGFCTDIWANEEKFAEFKDKEYVHYDHLPLETSDAGPIEVEFVSNVCLINDRKVIQCNLRDITARRQAEEALKQLNASLEQRVIERTAQLEAANTELEAFSYSVSHDLRTPLRAMDGFSQAVLEDYGTQLPEEGRRFLHTIRGGAQRMGALIDDLLTFSQLSRLPLDKQAVDSAALVQDALQDLSAQQAGRQIEMRLGGLPPCQGDRALLKQVWLNLLSNALKYSRDRKPALIEVGWIRNKENDEGTYFVRDNGTGFDMRYAKKLFGVFQRLHRAEDFEGTGVGLAIVQRIVHRHGGSVWAEAEVDRGATFYFTLEGNGAP